MFLLSLVAFGRDGFGVAKAGKQTSSPFSWIESGGGPSGTFVGGCDDTLEWCKTFVSPSSIASKPKATMKVDGHTKEHGYDYDLVVIGGGSGGLAASKEGERERGREREREREREEQRK